MNKEEKRAIKRIKKDLEKEKKLRGDYKFRTGFYENGYIERLLNLLEEQQKTIETNKKMTDLAETQLLTYAQGYRDGLHREVTATEIVAREREKELLCKYVEKNINIQWENTIKEKLEEIRKQYNNILSSDNVSLEFKNINSHRFDAMSQVLEELLKGI